MTIEQTLLLADPSRSFLPGEAAEAFLLEAIWEYAASRPRNSAEYYLALAKLQRAYVRAGLEGARVSHLREKALWACECQDLADRYEKLAKGEA